MVVNYHSPLISCNKVDLIVYTKTIFCTTVQSTVHVNSYLIIDYMGFISFVNPLNDYHTINRHEKISKSRRDILEKPRKNCKLHPLSKKGNVVPELWTHCH